MLPIMVRLNAIFRFRIFEHLGISHLTGKKAKIHNSKLAAIQEHLLLCCNHSPSFKDFSILTRESNDLKLKIMMRLLIARDKPVLNKMDSLLPLKSFWYNIRSYRKIFYRIIWSHSIPLWVCNCCLLNFQCYVASVRILWKTELMSI